MDIIWVLLGIGIGIVATIALVVGRDRIDRDAIRAEVAASYDARATAENARIVRAYEGRIQQLRERHLTEINSARQSSVDRSRAVLKGKMAEQVAPLLPGFTYWPADARFLGDPVDYVIFDGYSATRDLEVDDLDLEVVILDIKQGRSTLSRAQRRVAEAVAAGRVRFEVMRVLPDGTIRSKRWGYGADSDSADGGAGA